MGNEQQSIKLISACGGKYEELIVKWDKTKAMGSREPRLRKQSGDFNGKCIIK